MSEEEILKIQYEAIRQFCRGDRKLIFRVISELGATLREHIRSHGQGLTSRELVCLLERETRGWSSVC